MVLGWAAMALMEDIKAGTSIVWREMLSEDAGGRSVVELVIRDIANIVLA